jgi:hypothetical protein
MPYTLNGFGTKYYGKREPAEDGSYITTLWITGLYVPVLPLGSYRVLPVGAGSNYIVHRSQSYQVLRVPLCWEQVWHVYMIGAPILVIIGAFVWSGVKKDRVKDSIHTRMQVAGNEIDAAQVATEKLEGPCLGRLKGSKQDTKKDFASLRDDLHNLCAPVVPAIDAYLTKVGRMEGLIGEGLSGSALGENERNAFSAYRSIWGIRRHQAEETRQIVHCLEDFSSDCYGSVAPIGAAMEKEDKQVCSLLASVNEKCE